MHALEPIRKKAQATYDAAADHYDDPVNAYWANFGRRTVERLALASGSRVLDVCCGSGASAIPAAEHVGSHGSVLAVDLASNLIELGRAKATKNDLRNIEFCEGDMLDLQLEDESFDAIICVFGIFFAPDEVAAVRALWRLLRPGGRLAITTWGPDLFEPASSTFWKAVCEIRPELYKGFNPWDRICTPAALEALFERAGAQPVEAMAEDGVHRINDPADWWKIVMGSGYRGAVEQLSDDERERVRATTVAAVKRADVKHLAANVVYAVARKR